MRLTLRTLLAYLDDTLEPAQARLIGQKMSESEAAQELVARIKQVTRVTSSTLEGLVEQLEDVDAKAALEEIKRYNAAVRKDAPFNPNVKDGRCTEGLQINKSNWANTLDSPPFEAYAVTCGITFTFGGLRINDDGNVINTDGLPIRGLYAAGELVGGLFYFNYPGGTGLISGAVFGKIAGTFAARRAHDI